MKPRICHITTAHSPSDIRIFKKECKSLSNAGYDVHLIAPPKDKFDSGDVTIHFLSKERKRLDRMWSSVNEVFEIVDSINPWVVHLHDPELLRLVPGFVGRNIVIVYDAHEDLPEQISTKSYLPQFIRPLVGSSVNAYMRRQLKKCTAIVAATPHIKEELKSVGKPVYTVRNFPILENLPVSTDERERRVCYIGSITESRGILQMLDALSFTEDVEFDLVGPFGSSSLEERCRLHPNWEKTQYHGPLFGFQASQILHRASIGLVLLQPFPSYEKALPVKMFEYMNHSLPVLASDFELWRSILQDAEAGVCVDSSSPVAIGEAINELLNDSSGRSQMGEKGKNAVMSQYNWTSEAEQLIELYEGLNLSR